MEQSELTTTREWHAYVAGFFDGEGSVCIARHRANGRSDYHKIVVAIGQRTEHAAVLHRIAAEFGGSVSVRTASSRVRHLWASYSNWQLQGKARIHLFFEAIQPYVLIKRPQIEIGLEFIQVFVPPAESTRDKYGQIRGWIVSREQVEARERLRVAMFAANEKGPPKGKPSILPPLDVDMAVRLTETELADKLQRNATLTASDARAIMAEYATGTITQRALAKRYGVSRYTVGDLVNGITYKRVKRPARD